MRALCEARAGSMGTSPERWATHLVPDISWSDDELEQIKALGVSMVQLSIAWGRKTSQ